ncbi:MAG: hypothetical protein QOD75_1128 [Blastocatellia bacterium]|nr:hypothetical protein [Blastocatellia bacterium]
MGGGHWRLAALTRLPRGLLDRLFYGRLATRNVQAARFNGLNAGALARASNLLKPLSRKHAKARSSSRWER